MQILSAWLLLCAPALILTLYQVAIGLPLAKRLLPQGSDFSMRYALGAVIVLTLIFTFGWLRYLLGLGNWSHFLVPLIAGVLLLANGRRLVFAGEGRNIATASVAYGLVFLYGLFLAAQMAFPTGGGWAYDWQEHYQRSLFFLFNDRNYDIKFLIWTIPARPPLINIVSGHLMALTGLSYALYHAAMLALGAQLVPVLVLLARRWRPEFGARTAACVGVALLMNPAFVQHMTYSWTRLPVGMATLAGCFFYLSGWRHKQAASQIAGLCCLCIAVLGHYSAAPYALAFGLHFAGSLVINGGLRGLRPLLLAAMLIFLLAAPWFIWSFAHFGISGTLSATSTVGQNSSDSFITLAAQFLKNVWFTVIPHFCFGRHALGSLWQVRDFFFLLYQNNLLFMPGAFSLWIGLAVFTRLLREGQVHLRSVLLWFPIFALIASLAIATLDNVYADGVAHIGLLPLALGCVVWVAAVIPAMPPFWRCLWISGLVLDFLAGILIHFIAQRNWQGHSAASFIAHFRSNSGYLFIYDLAGSTRPLLLLLAIFILPVLALFLKRSSANH